MADRGRVLWQMEKRGKNNFFWEIEVIGKETHVKAGKIGASAKALSPYKHKSPFMAKKFATREVEKKVKQGFREIEEYDDDQNGAYDQEEEYDHTPGGFQYQDGDFRESDYDEYERGYDDTQPGTSFRDYPDGGGQNSDHDTESIASTSSFQFVPAENQHVSPLNRRRSVRLAHKREEAMEEEYAPPTALLTRQSTTAVLRQQLAGTKLDSQTRKLERMDTNKEWTGWRDGDIPKLQKQQTTNPQLKRKKSSARGLPDIPEDEEQPTAKKVLSKSKTGKSSPGLMKKQSTTASLRAMFGSAMLEDSDSDGVDEADGAGDGRGRGKLKRKATTLLSPVSEVAPKAVKSAMRKPTIGKPSPKRQATVNVKFTDTEKEDAGHGGRAQKKRKVGGQLRRQTTILSGDMVFIPPLQRWPINMPCQEVWSVPLASDDGSPSDAQGVLIDSTKCLVSDNTGRVLELDSTVTPSSLMNLPYPTCAIKTDGEFTYAGCTTGHVYDISQTQPRLVFHALDFGEITKMGVHGGLVAMGDTNGRLSLLAHDGTAKWTVDGSGNTTHLVEVDDTGVYHSYTGGVSKYSVLDGSSMWQTELSFSTRGVMTSKHLYLTSGTSISKLDKFNGNVVQIYGKASAQTDVVANVCVGDQIVFAVGSSNNIVCYHEATGNVVYVCPYSGAVPAQCVRYFSGRLFCAGSGGLDVLDFSETVVEEALQGNNLMPVEVAPCPKTKMTSPLKRVASVRRKSGGRGKSALNGVIVQCSKAKARKGKLKVRALSIGFNKQWDVQLPVDLVKDGKKYLVSSLSPTDTGKFYRISGDIKEVE